VSFPACACPLAAIINLSKEEEEEEEERIALLSLNNWPLSS
jgi:hypothetical protein